MKLIFDSAQFTRQVMANFLEELSYEQLTEIPDNFNNSIFWNITHTLVTQQLLTYRLAGLPLQIDENFVEKYGKGSIATTDIPTEDIEYVKNNLISASIKLQEDFEKGIFKQFEPYHTSVGISLYNIEEALNFNTFHDGIHLGIAMSIKKIV
ncbi:MAG: DinB family protein [Bacteroidota bacterium]